MSNFAEFDVPEPNSQSEETNQTETNKEPKAQPKQANKTPTKTKKRNTGKTLSFLLAVVGIVALFPVAFKTVNLWFKTEATFPLQAEVAPYTIMLLIVSFVCLKLSSRNPLAKLGLLAFYITTAGYIVYKIYEFVTTGNFSWV